MEFSRQEYWSRLLFPSPGNLPMPGIEPGSPALQVESSLSEPPGKPSYISPGINEMMDPEQGQGGIIKKAEKETESSR